MKVEEELREYILGMVDGVIEDILKTKMKGSSEVFHNLRLNEYKYRIEVSIRRREVEE